MVKSFSRYARLFTVLGCFFIRNFDGKSEKEPSVKWRSGYTVYSAFCFTLMPALQTWGSYDRLSQVEYSTLFTEALLSTVELCILLKAIVNFMCMTVGSNAFLELFRKAAAFEYSAGIPCLVRLPINTCTWFRALRRLAVAISIMIAVAGSLTYIVQVFITAYKYSMVYELCKMVLCMVSLVAFAIYELSMYIVLCTVSEVLVYYVRSQGLALRKCERCIRQARIDGKSAALVVENIRRNLCSIRELKDCLSDIWAPSIVTFLLLTLWALCTTLYCLFIGHGNHVDLWLALAYSAYCVLTLLDLAVLSHELRSETENVLNYAARATMLHSDDAYIRQIQFLHDSIDPDGMLLTGANFFRLDRGLLVSLAGSVITYTVILVQTSNGWSSRLSEG